MPLTKVHIYEMINEYITDENKMNAVIDMCVSKATQLMKSSLNELNDNVIGKLDAVIAAKKSLDLRVSDLEHQITVNDIHMDLLRRKLDDTEQYTRRPNLIIDGIRVSPDESPTTLRKKLLNEIDSLNIDIDDCDIDRVHRHEDPYFDNYGNKMQPVIVRFTSWYARNELYRVRNESRYRYRADITPRRQQILDFAWNFVESKNLYNVIDFVSVDRNCRLIIRSKSGIILSFSSELEFKRHAETLIDPDYRLEYGDKLSFEKPAFVSRVPTVALSPPSPTKPPALNFAGAVAAVTMPSQ